MTDADAESWYSAEISTFGDRLAAAREAANMSRKDLAKKLGVKLSTLLNWEEDLNEPRANKLQMVAGVLGVSLSWLLTGEGEGVDAPMDQGDIPQNIDEILTDLRALQAQIKRSGDRVAQLEKRLRTVLKEMA